MEENLLTIKEISNRENKSIKMIRRVISAQKIKVHKKSNKGAILVSERDYNEWKKGKNPYNLDFSNDLIINEEVYNDEYEFIDIKKEFSKKDGWNSEYRNGLKFIDLFSGAGGMSCGFAMAGYEPVGNVEILECAVNTYKRNFIDSNKFSHENTETRDIKLRETKEFIINNALKNKVDLIIGGFPCQGFSMSGNRVFIDPRNSLYLDMLEIVKRVRPKVVVMENVEGLRNMLGGKVEKKILSDYKDIGYKISAHTINSADFGVAQIRKRVFFIANCLDQVNLFPKPILEKQNYKTLGEEIERFLEMEEKKENNHIFTKHSQNMKTKLSQVPEGKSLYKNYSDAWKKSPWEQPSCTIKENHGGVNIHPKLPRVLTPREMAALQSFPDDFVFEGAKKWQLVQIGNAVPPLMAKAIATAILKMLK